jgi:hypothetical protein
MKMTTRLLILATLLLALGTSAVCDGVPPHFCPPGSVCPNSVR